MAHAVLHRYFELSRTDVGSQFGWLVDVLTQARAMGDKVCVRACVRACRCEC